MTTIKDTYYQLESLKSSQRLEEKSVANLGLENDQIATIEGGGEYHGLSIQAKENIKPLIFKETMLRALRMILDDRITTAMKILHVPDINLKTFYYIINKWLSYRKIDPPNDFLLKEDQPENHKKLDEWLKSNVYSPILGRIEIVETGNRVVPEEWIGREFKNAEELHKAMDGLPWRKGKSPVTFCAIYSGLILQGINNTNKWIDKSQIDKSVAYTIIINKSNCQIIKGVSTSKHHRYIVGEYPTTNSRLLFSIDYDNVIASKESTDTQRISVGLMASRLQKSIRRGSGAINTLIDSIRILNRALPYNIPEQQFLRVSAVRQSVWRLLISTMEDVIPYLPSSDGSYFSMDELAGLALFCQVSTDSYFKKSIIDKIIYTAMLIQHVEEFMDYDSVDEIDVPRSSGSIGLKLVWKYMPKMSYDDILIGKAINYMKKYPEKIIPLKTISTLSLLKLSKISIEKDAFYASYDMHNHPSIILELQGSIPFLPSKDFTTKKISAFIWNYSSSYNYRKENRQIPTTKEGKIVLENLLNIQKLSLDGFKINETIVREETSIGHTMNSNKIPKIVSRTAFLLLFGKVSKLKFKGRVLDVYCQLDDESTNPFRFKQNNRNQESIVLEGDDAKAPLSAYLESKDRFRIETPLAPDGYKWGFVDKSIKLSIKKDSKLRFLVDNKEVSPNDCSSVLIKIGIPSSTPFPRNMLIKNLSETALYTKDSYNRNGYYLNKLMLYVHKSRLIHRDYRIYDISDLAQKVIPAEVWKDILVSFNDVSDDGQIFISHVDGQGKKIDNAVNYRYEGVKWRLMNLLSMLYPQVISSDGTSSLSF